MPRGLYGATDLTISQFRGVVEDTDPTELDADRAAACLNVDFRGEVLRKRLGKVPYAATNTGNFPILGLHAYYPKDGSDRILLQAGVNGTFADQGAGFVHDLGMSIAGTDGVDFTPFQDRVYIGNYIGGLYRWDGDPSQPAEPVESPIPPVLNTPTTTVVVGQDCADATDWTASDPDLTANDLTMGGTPVLHIIATTSVSEGEYLEAQWSAGATLDLSQVDKIGLSLYGISGPGTMIQIGIMDNAGVIQWIDPTISAEVGWSWEKHEVDISSIDPADRDASTGLAIAWVSGPSAGITYPYGILIGPIYLVAGFEADTYRYYMTHYNEDRLYESAPSNAGVVTLAPQHRVYSIDLLVSYGGADVSHVRIYRHRDDAPYAKPLLVAEIPNDSVLATYEDQRSDADLLLEGAETLTTQYQIDPPHAKTYAIVGNRMLAGACIIDGEYRPWSLYLSYYGRPHAFASAQDAADPLAGGFIDLGEKDAIVRIIDIDGNAVIFCERSIWTLEGTGWDDFILRKRASVGLDARWGVGTYGRLLLFLASDGIRALALSFGADQQFSTWTVSEPVATRLRAIPKAYRHRTAFGIDERERLHVSYTAPGSTVNNAAVVLDLQQPGALTNKQDPTRPGWTRYEDWGFSVFHTLKRGGGDDGELLGGDVAVGRVWRLHRSAAGADLETDNGDLIAWSYTGPCVDMARGKTADLVYLGAELDPAPGEEVTLSVVLDRGASTEEKTASLGAQTAGIVTLQPRLPVRRARYVQWGISGEQDVAMRVRSGGVGFYAPKVR
jgi:hypothetical protein